MLQLLITVQFITHILDRSMLPLILRSMTVYTTLKQRVQQMSFSSKFKLNLLLQFTCKTCKSEEFNKMSCWKFELCTCHLYFCIKHLIFSGIETFLLNCHNKSNCPVNINCYIYSEN